MVESAPVDSVPEVAFVPDHTPEAMHVAALVDDHVSVAAWFGLTVAGLALSDSVGGAIAVTVTDWLALPPGPVHVSVKLLVTVSAPVDSVPDTGRLPDHAPDAAQDVAFDADQLRTEAAPATTEVGLALSVRTGPALGSVGTGPVPGPSVCTEPPQDASSARDTIAAV